MCGTEIYCVSKKDTLESCTCHSNQIDGPPYVRVQTNLDSHSELFIVLESSPRLPHHLAHQLIPLNERGAHPLLDRPPLRAPTVELDAVRTVPDKLGGRRELVGRVRRELHDERAIRLLGGELDLARPRRLREAVRHDHGRVRHVAGVLADELAELELRVADHGRAQLDHGPTLEHLRGLFVCE